MFKSFSMDLAGRKLTVEVGRVAAQANRCSIYALRRYCSTFYSNRICKAKRRH